VASVYVYPSHGGASIDVNASLLTTQSDLNILDPASIYDALDDRARINLNLGAKDEMAYDFTHAQRYLQSRTQVPEITKDHANQPRSFMLFGKVIFRAPSSEVKHTSIQSNQNHGWSCDMTSTMVVYDQSYPSGPSSNWSGVSTDSYHHQSGFSNLMPYGLVNGIEPWPFQYGRSAFVNWGQVPYPVNMIPHSMMRGGVDNHMGPRSKIINLHNFEPTLPDTSRPQLSGPVTPSGTNGEGTSTSNTSNLPTISI
jgi:hypothetical protein